MLNLLKKKSSFWPHGNLSTDISTLPYIFVKNNIFRKLQPMGWRLATFLENEWQRIVEINDEKFWKISRRAILQQTHAGKPGWWSLLLDQQLNWEEVFTKEAFLQLHQNLHRTQRSNMSSAFRKIEGRVLQRRNL